MKEFIKSILSFFKTGINENQVMHSTQELSSIGHADNMTAGLGRLKKNGINPSTIIDLGAAQGNWSLSAMNYWPQSQYLLFEPLSERKNELESLKSGHENIHIVYAAAGSEKGTINFSVTGDLDGSGVYENHPAADVRTIDVRTIDEEVKQLNLQPPYLIKFDTHGFEVPILEGAKSVLQQTEAIIMECYGFHISKNSLLLHEMCAVLSKFDFRLADIVDIMRRPGDEFFWQCDLFFVRSSHPSFKKNTYQ